MMRILFLEALKASLKNEKVQWEQPIPADQWKALFDLAEEQKVLPMIFDAVYACPAAKSADQELFRRVGQWVRRLVMVQTVRTGEFLELYRHLKQSGLNPILVKGLVCRELYPNPDFRGSGDEDLLIRPEDFPACHEAMLTCGMKPLNPEMDMDKAYEVPYFKGSSPLCIELHRHLFPRESEAYGDLNDFFETVHSHSIKLELQGTAVTAMEHTDHFFYLICHAFKHFLHSGFGIRQVCDIALYANAYGGAIDWQYVWDQCEAIRAGGFAAAVLRIGQKYLTLAPETACIPESWTQTEVDEQPMLEDLLSGGVYGGATQSRRHSSNMTLEAVARQKQEGKGKASVRTSLFPPAEKLEGRYPWLKKYPVLLPVAWCDRIIRYGRETAATDSGVMEAMRIGKDRVALLKEYGIIE